MPVACDRSKRGIDPWLIAVLVAMGGPFLWGCTEKPDSRALRPSPAIATPEKSIQRVPLPPPPTPTARVPTPRPVQHAKVDKAERKTEILVPSRLVGLSPPDIGRILGKPSEAREEAMMIRWTYSGQNCALDIFFYPDIATGSLRALKYNIGDIKGRPGHGHACTNYLMMARSDESG